MIQFNNCTAVEKGLIVESEESPVLNSMRSSNSKNRLAYRVGRFCDHEFVFEFRTICLVAEEFSAPCDGLYFTVLKLSFGKCMLLFGIYCVE